MRRRKRWWRWSVFIGIGAHKITIGDEINEKINDVEKWHSAEARAHMHLRVTKLHSQRSGGRRSNPSKLMELRVATGEKERI